MQGDSFLSASVEPAHIDCANGKFVRVAKQGFAKIKTNCRWSTPKNYRVVIGERREMVANLLCSYFLTERIKVYVIIFSYYRSIIQQVLKLSVFKSIWLFGNLRGIYHM